MTFQKHSAIKSAVLSFSVAVIALTSVSASENGLTEAVESVLSREVEAADTASTRAAIRNSWFGGGPTVQELDTPVTSGGIELPSKARKPVKVKNMKPLKVSEPAAPDSPVVRSVVRKDLHQRELGVPRGPVVADPFFTNQWQNTHPRVLAETSRQDFRDGPLVVATDPLPDSSRMRAAVRESFSGGGRSPAVVETSKGSAFSRGPQVLNDPSLYPYADDPTDGLNVMLPPMPDLRTPDQMTRAERRQIARSTKASERQADLERRRHEKEIKAIEEMPFVYGKPSNYTSSSAGAPYYGNQARPVTDTNRPLKAYDSSSTYYGNGEQLYQGKNRDRRLWWSRR